jgi:hypothetical protein
MHQRVVLLVLLAFAGLSCDPSNPVGYTAAGNYLPLSTGNTWIYGETVAGAGTDTTVLVTVRLDSPYTYNGVAWYGVNNFCVDRMVSSPMPLYCAAWGANATQVLFWRLGPGPGSADYEVVLDFPLWLGKSWLTVRSIDTMLTTSGGDTLITRRIDRRTVKGFPAVTVPAGSFSQTVEVADTTFSLSDYRPGPLSGTVRMLTQSVTIATEWFAKDVGMVKQDIMSFTNGDIHATSEHHRVLTSYTVKGL